MWKKIDKHIYQCNGAMAESAGSANIRATGRARLVAKARCIRALLYFHAVDCWGNVPLVVSSDYRLNESIGRTPKEEVYEQIIFDLQYAVQHMGNSYPAAERARPNRLTALALLSRVYLFQEQWELAARAATDVISSGVYSLEASLTNVFLKGSNEVIWQFAPSTGSSSHTPGFDHLPINIEDNNLPQFVLDHNLYTSFDLTDRRKIEWVGTKPSGPNYYAYKYKQRLSPMAGRTEYTVILRLAEQFLIRAEARAQLNQLPEAIADLNILRLRASAEEFAVTSSTELVLAYVEQERYRELFADWGAHRWFDLKRTGRINAVTGSLKGSNWESTDALWPIPLEQLLTNPKLEQNDGY